jgi:hypothetical protein
MVPAKEPEPYQMITPDDIKEALIQTAKDEARMDRYRDEESRLLKDLRANPFPRLPAFWPSMPAWIWAEPTGPSMPCWTWAW